MTKSIYLINCPPGWLKTAPLNLVFLQTYLKNHGVSVKAVDLNMAAYQLLRLEPQRWLGLNKDLEAGLFAQLSEKFAPLIEYLYQDMAAYDIIGLSISGRSQSFGLALAGNIKDRYPEKTIVFGGPQTLSLARQGRLGPTDRWVVGEGEIPLAKIAEGDPGQIFQFEELPDLDRLPFPDFGCVNLKAYSPAIPLLSSRGCPYACRFCSERLLYKKLKSHSPGYMVEAIKYLKRSHQISTFVFCDSLINHTDGWLDAFCAKLMREVPGIKWEAQFRVKPGFSLDTARLLKQSGCYNLFVGLESGCDKVLTQMHKGFDTGLAEKTLKTLHTAGLHFEVSLIAGFPDETEDDFRETVDFLRAHKNIIPKIAQVNPFMDHLGQYPDKQFPDTQGWERTQRLVSFFQEEKIKYTKSFVGNLGYPLPA